MLDLKPLGENPDARWFPLPAKTTDREQQLVLLRLHPRPTRRRLAKVQKPSDLVPKLRQSLVI